MPPIAHDDNEPPECECCGKPFQTGICSYCGYHNGLEVLLAEQRRIDETEL